ncbi:Cacna1h, partial [Symbiodinium sp. KB8]
DELLKQPVRGSNLSLLPMPKRQSSAPSPTRLPGISETERGHALQVRSKEYGYESPLGSKDGDPKKRSKEYAIDSPLGSKADMALRNIALKVDTERMKKRYEMTSVNSRSSDGGPGHVLRQCVRSSAFDSFFALLVLTNTIFIGIEVQQTLHQDHPPAGYVVVQYVYTGFFTFELLLRALAGGYAFFCGRDWAWSWLDVLVVVSSWAEIVFDILAATGVAHTSGFRALRVVRITRFLKTLRLVRVFRFVLSLRTLITSILYTLKSLFWALVLLKLMLIIYLFSVLLAQAVCEYRITPDFDLLPQRAKDSVDRYYTSLPRMMLSLFMAICGGVSWEDVLEPLEHISLVWVVVFLFYIQFTYFAVLNVLTGVFCQSAVESAQNDHANVVQSMLANKEEKIRALFSKLGADEEGHITYAMFEEGLTSPAVVQHFAMYFETLGLDVWDAWVASPLEDQAEPSQTAYTEIQGAWSPGSSSYRQPQAPWKNDHKPPSQFPTFDRKWGPAPAISVVKETRQPAEASSSSTVAPQVQQAVNLLRKAENRVLRIRKDQAVKAERFAAYEKEVLAAHALEEQRYQALQERLASELIEATQQVEAAKRTLAETVPHLVGEGMDISTDTAPEAAKASWDRLQSRHPVPSGPPTLDAELMEVLRAYKSGQLTMRGPPPDQARPRQTERVEATKRGAESPSGRVVTHQMPQSAHGAPAYGPTSPTAALGRTAPYPPVSPCPHPPVTGTGGEATAEVSEKPTSPIPPVLQVPEGEPSRLPKRQSAKDATRSPPEKVVLSGTTLQAKLDARRERENGGPLHPQGLSAAPAAPSDRPAPAETTMPTAAPDASFIEDGVGYQNLAGHDAFSGFSSWQELERASAAVLEWTPTRPRAVPKHHRRRKGRGVFTLPVDAANAYAQESSDFLGIKVYADGYVPVDLGIPVEAYSSLVATTAQVARIVQSVLPGLDKLTAIRPQREDGSASFLAYSSVMEQAGLVPVMVDLTWVGGHYFPDLVTPGILVNSLLERYALNLNREAEGLHIRLGWTQQPHASYDRIHPLPGDALTFLPSHAGQAKPKGIFSHFEQGASRTPLRLIPSLCYSPGCAVWLHDGLHAFVSRHYHDLHMGKRLAKLLGISAEAVQGLLFNAFPNLSVRGEHCSQVLVPYDKSEIGAHTTAVVVDARQTGFSVNVSFRDLQWSALSDMQSLLTMAATVAGIPGSLYPCLGVEVIARLEAEGESRLLGLHLLLRPKTSADSTFHLQPPEGPSASIPAPAASHLEPAIADRVAPMADSQEDDVDTRSIEPSVDAPSDVHCSFLILAVDTTPKQVHIAIEFPCTVVDALDAVAFELDDAFSKVYSRLAGVQPQLSEAWGACIAVPTWAIHEPIGVLDLRQLDGRIFACVLPANLTRQRLLDLADVDPEANPAIYAFGRHSPLEGDTEIPLLTHGSIVFLPAGSPFHPCGLLTDMLQDRLNWLPDPFIPIDFEPSRAGSVCLVTAETYKEFVLLPGRREHYLLDVSNACSIPLHWTTVQIARPPVLDVSLLGRCCKGVAMVLDEVPNVPLPPRRPGFQPFGVLVDCRPIFLGLEQWVVHEAGLLLAELIERYSLFTLDDYDVIVEGAEVQGGELRVGPGHVLTVRYATGLTSHSESSDSGVHEEVDLAEDSTSAGNISQHTALSGVSEHSGRSHSRDRSRSPRGAGGRRPSDTQPEAPMPIRPNTLPSMLPEVRQEEDTWLTLKWKSLFMQDALREGPEVDTPEKVSLFDATITSDIVQADVEPTLCWLERLSSPGAIQHKQLLEPTGGGETLNRRLDSLRFVANEFGEAWPHVPTDGTVPINPGVLQDPDDTSIQAGEVTRWLSVFVLKPQFAPERLLLELRFPATVDDLWEAVGLARNPLAIALFPHLQAAAPQPQYDVVVLLAMPAWYGFAQLACADLSAIDGRIFALRTPDYLTRRSALRLVDLPPDSDIRLFVGYGEEPVEDDTQVHLFPGITLRFLPAHQVPGRSFALPQRLLSAEGWTLGSHFGATATERHYCLVLRYGYRLFEASTCPMQFRARLADSIGLRPSDIAVFPATPRTTDVELDGVPCQTTLVVVPKAFLHEADAAFCVLVDCRCLLDGWRSFRVCSSPVLAETFLGPLNEDAPLGLRAAINGATVGYERVAVSPGQVLLAQYVVDDPPAQVPDPTDHPWEHSVPSLETGPEGPSSPRDGDANASQAVRVARYDSFQPVFLVCFPDHLPGVFTLDLQAPANFAQALLQLRDLLPSLPFLGSSFVEVVPQPDMAFATVLSLPSWPSDECVVLVDGRLCDSRFFALVVSPVTDRQSLLAAAGFDTQSPLVVYVRDSAWPIPSSTGAVRLCTGDLVTVAPVGHPTLIAATLSDMLFSAYGWVDAGQIDVTGPHLAWLLTDTEPLGIPSTFSRTETDAEQAARALHIDETDLGILVEVDSLYNFSDRGRHTTQVLIALSSHGDICTSSQTPCVLDLRPLLMGVQLVSFPRGLVDSTELAARFARFCPATFSVRITGGDCGQALPAGYREIMAGDVLVVSFEADTGNNSSDDFFPAGRPATWSSAPATAAMLSRGSISPFPVLSVSVDGAVTASDAHEAAAFPHSRASHRRARRSAGRTPLRTCLFAICLIASPEMSAAVRTDDATFRSGAIATTTDAETLGRQCRPLPTPCRAPRWVPRESGELPTGLDDKEGFCYSSTHDLHLSRVIGPTLLEQALSAPGNQAFFLASTLLDVLLEHLAEKASQHLRAETCPVCSLPSAATTVCLESVIPPTDYQQLALGLEALTPATPGQDGRPDGPLEGWLDADLQGLPAKWISPFSCIRSWHNYPEHEPTSSLDIFTDGSADGPNVAFPNSGHLSAPCAWAFTVWAVTPAGSLYIGGAAHTSVPAGTPFHVGETADNPLTSEILAMIWALVWTLEHGVHFGLPIRFCYDCTAAGEGIAGVSRLPNDPGHVLPGPLASFAACLRQRLQVLAKVSFLHVAGHAGHIGNELADQLAKQARRRIEDVYERMLPVWPQKLFEHPLQSWFWLAGSSQPALPALTALECEAHRLQTQPVIDVAVPTMGTSISYRTAKRLDFVLRVASYNVLTLFDPAAAKGRKARASSYGMMIAGKRDLIKRQMMSERIWALGLQETRLPESATLPDSDLLMLSSGATSHGHYGCSLWLNLKQAIAWQDGKPCYVSKEHVVVTSQTPRYLQTQIDTPWIRLTVAVAHGPSAEGTDASAARNFWRDVASSLQKRPATSHIVLLTDANAKVGSIETPSVGGHHAQEECLVGQVFHEFLCELGCMLPSTQSHCHVGQSWTWLSPGQPEVKHRIDYVGVPLSWEAFEMHSRVWTELEALQARLDHYPILLQVAFCVEDQPLTYASSRRKVCRPDPHMPETAKQTYLERLVQAPCVPWQDGVDHHFSSIVQVFDAADRASRQPAPLCPRQDYLSTDTLALVQQRAALRQYMRSENTEHARRLKIIVFAAFLHYTGRARLAASAQATAASWLTQLDVSIARAWGFTSQLTAAIRSAVKLDRTTYLHGLVQNITSSDLRYPRQLFAAVRKAFPQAKAAKKSALRPLPTIRLADGSLADCPATRVTRWRDFFGEQEAGFQVSGEQYRAFDTLTFQLQ